jgi:hypothetical protein
MLYSGVLSQNNCHSSLTRSNEVNVLSCRVGKLVLWQLELAVTCIIYWSLNWLLCNFLFFLLSSLSFSSHQLNGSQGLYTSSVHVTHSYDKGDQITCGISTLYYGWCSFICLIIANCLYFEDCHRKYHM